MLNAEIAVSWLFGSWRQTSQVCWRTHCQIDWWCFQRAKASRCARDLYPLKINIQITSEIRIFFTFVPGRETSAQVGTLQQDRATRDFGAELFSRASIRKSKATTASSNTLVCAVILQVSYHQERILRYFLHALKVFVVKCFLTQSSYNK